MEQVVLQGHKGGSQKAHQPAETRNNLLSKSFAKVLVAIGEGEFAGVPTAQDIYLNGTPLESGTGLENFGGVKWEYRPGTIDQAHIAGMPDISNEYPIGFDLTNAVAYTRLITNSQLDAIRVTLAWPSLFQQKDNGDIVGYNIAYAIDISTNGGAYVEQGQWDTNKGKTTVEYNRTHRLNLPKPGTSWTLRVRRITPNQNNVKFQDIMTVKSVGEVIDARLRYPNTALLYVEFDAELFGGTSIPRISLKTKGRLIQVPSNYNPVTRIYTGVWNGAFKWAWTDNPAWVFYDLVTNERFGLGSRIKATMVDKWTLYQVAQYCDVMVSNGAGGTEPRYTCNIYIQSRKEAWQVLRDIVGIFNGMLYWSGTQMVASADMPVAVNTVRNYNRSNVIDGKFSYGSTSEKTIYTSSLVSYDNPENHFETAVEAVNDLNLVQRYKTWAQAELSAIGCTSRGQAQRKGKYTMLTNSLNRLVTFKLGLEGYLPKPGEVIGVADQVLAGVNLAGRISTATLNTVTLDRVSNAVAGDILYVNKPDGVASEGRTVLSVNGKVVTVTTNYSAIPTSELGWYVEKTTLKSQLYRVTKVAWGDDEGQYEVTGVQYEDSKFAAVDNGARLESRPITSIPAGGQAAPTNLTLTAFTFVEQTMAVTTMSVKWTPVAGAMNYEAQWRKDGGDWNTVGLTASAGFDVKGIYKGAYQARVRAINAIGTKSVWVESTNTQLDGKVGAPPTLTAFTTAPEIFGIRINWAFTPGSEDGAYIQLQEAIDINGTNTAELSYVAYPAVTYVKTNMLGGVVRFYRGRLIDRTGNQGAWTPWTYGISEYGTDKILASIVGEIERTQLGHDLLSELDTTKIDIDQTKLDVSWLEAEVTGLEQQVQSDVNDLNDSVSDISGTVNGLKEQLNGIVDALVYDKTKTYKSGDIVRSSQRLYQALTDVPVDSTPPNLNYWKDVGQVVKEFGAMSAQVQVNTASITSQGGTITSQAQQLSGLDSRVGASETALAGQATTISNLQTTVTQQGNSITSQGQAITDVTASVGQLGASGVNLLPAEYAVYNAALPVLGGSSFTTTSVADAATLRGYALKVDFTSASTGLTAFFARGINGPDANMSMKPQKYIISYYAKASVDGHVIAMYLKTFLADNVTALNSASATQQALTTGWARYSYVVDVSSASFTGNQMMLALQPNRSGVANRTVWLDRIMVEPVTGAQTTPSVFSAGPSNDQSAANAAATTALTARVTTAEGTITSQSSSITTLQNNVGSIGAAGTNLLVDTYSWLTSTTLPVTNKSSGSLDPIGVAVAEAASGFGYKFTTTGVSTGTYLMLCPTNNAAGWNMPMEAGTYLVSFWASSPTTASLRARLYSSTTSAYSPTITLTPTRTRYAVAVTQATAATQAVLFYYNMSGITATEITVDSVMVEKVAGTGTSQLASPFIAGNSAATTSGLVTTTSALSNTVTQQGNTITTQGQSITNISAAVDFKEVDELYAEGDTDGQIADALQIANGAATATTSLTATVSQQGDIITAQGQSITSLTSSLTGVQGSVTGQGTAIQNLQTTTTQQGNTITVQGQSLTALSSDLDIAESNITANSTAITNLTTTVTNVDGKVDATTREVRALTATARQNDGTGDLADALNMWRNTAAIQTESIARANEDGAMASMIETITATVNDNIAAIQTEATARATADDVSASYIQTLITKSGDNAAAIQTEATARASGDSANATQITTLQANLGTTNANVVTNANAIATTNGQLAAAYSVKLGITSGGVYYGAGMGIGIENTPAGMQSQVIFLADRFAIMNSASGVYTAPFVVQGGQVIINNAMIGTATIGTAMIADGTITSAKIPAAQIGTAHIMDATISTAKIQDLSVSTLKIGNESVIVPRWAGYAPTYNCNGTWQTPLSLSFTLPVGGMVFVTYCSGFGSYGTKVYTYQLIVDSTLVAQSSANWSDSSITLGAGLYLAAGTHTAVFQINGEAGCVLSYQNLMVQGIMK